MESKIPSFTQMMSEFDAWVEEHYPKGKKLRWAWGKYEGRIAEVNRATWESSDGTFQVLVTVKTMRADGQGFLDNSNLFHRIYREVDKYFTPFP